MTQPVGVIINIDRTEAIRASSSTWGRMEIYVPVEELSGRQRATLADISAAMPSAGNEPIRLYDKVSLDRKNVPHPVPVPPIGKVDGSTIGWLLDEIDQAAGKAAEERLRKAAPFVAEFKNWMALPPAGRVRQGGAGIWVSTPPNPPKDMVISPIELEALLPGAEQAKAEASDEARRRNVETARLNREVAAEAAARKEAAERAERAAAAVAEAAFDRILRAMASSEQLERHDAGLLPERERHDIVRESLLRPFKGWTKRVKITDDELARLRPEALGASFLYESVPAPDASPEEFAALKAATDIGANFPKAANVTLMEARGAVDDEGDTWLITRRFIRVEFVVGGNLYSREFEAAVPATI